MNDLPKVSLPSEVPIRGAKTPEEFELIAKQWMLSQGVSFADMNTFITALNNYVVDLNATDRQLLIDAINAAAEAQQIKSDVLAIALGNFPDAIWATTNEATHTKLREAVRHSMDRSGFTKFGGVSTSSGRLPVNKGLTANLGTSAIDGFWLGYSLNAATRDNPEIAVNGSIVRIQSMANALQNVITLPPAPTIFSAGTSTTGTPQEKLLISKGICIEHADVTNSGSYKNGDFSLGSQNWTKDAQVTITGGEAYASSGGNLKNTDATLVAGLTYAIEVNVSAVDASFLPASNNFYEYLTDGTAKRLQINGIGQHKFEIIAGASGEHKFRITGTLLGTSRVASITAFPEKVQNRSDLPFIEYWYENTAEKGFLSPSVQYMGGDFLGNGKLVSFDDATYGFAGADTYSLMGSWQVAGSIIGKGYPIANMTFADIVAYTTHPDTNCFYGEDGVLVEGRYRARSVAGLDDTFQVDSNVGNLATTSENIGVQGKKVVGEDIRDTGSVWYGKAHSSGLSTDETLFSAGIGGAIDTDNGYKGMCYAFPLAIVKRYNQVAYHPIYNERGTAWFDTIIGNSRANWFDAVCHANSSSIDAFRFMSTTTNGKGSVIGADSYGSGRPDGQFYDNIMPSDIVDNRLSIYDHTRKSANALAEKFQNGTARGAESEWVTESCIELIGSATGQTLTVIDNTKFKIGAVVQFNHNGNNFRRVVSGLSNTDRVEFTESFARVVGARTTYSVNSGEGLNSGTRTHCDIIGNPDDYSQATKNAIANGYSLEGTPNLVDDQGNDLIPDGVDKPYKLSRPVIAKVMALYSDDNEATWTPHGLVIDPVTNAFSGVHPLGRLLKVYFLTPCNALEATTNTTVLDRDIGDVLVTSDKDQSAFIHSIINKVPVGSETTYLPKTKYNLTDNKVVDVEYEGSDLTASDVALVAVPVKTVDGVQFNSRELKHNGTDWGDSVVKIVATDNVGIDTDDNSKTILISSQCSILKSDLV